MILITGAGGKTGKTLVKRLSEMESVRAFVRREEQVAALQSLGAEKVIVGDLRDQTAVREAMRGIRAIYHICPNMSPDEVEIGKLVITEAKAAGAEHFVYHSVLHPQIEAMPHHWAKLRVEEMTFESGIPFTVLQPAPYMQNLMANWKSITDEGVLRVPYSIHAKFSFLDLEDLAEVASVVLRSSDHFNAVYELAGISPISHVEIASILSRILKREVHAEKEETEAWKGRAMGLSAYAIENLTRMFEYYDQWGLTGNTSVLRWLIRKEPASLETFIERTALTD